MTTTTNEYRIGTHSVYMTDEQAAAWNDGEWSESIFDGAILCIPTSHGAKSFVRDGEVIVVDGLPGHDEVSLFRWCEDHQEDAEKYLNNREAVLVERDR